MPTYNFLSRRLSEYETVLDLLHHQGDGIFCHVMVLKSRHQMNVQVIRNAFKWLVHYQPSLRMCVQTEIGIHGLAKRFAERADVNAFDITEINPTTDKWETVLEEEYSRPFVSSDGPLWKVIFMEIPNKVFMDIQTGDTIYTYGLVFKASHVLADHVSVHTMLSKQLMKLLERTHDLSGLDPFKTPLFMKPSVDLSFTPVTKSTLPVIKKEVKCVPTSSSSLKPGNTSLGLSQEFTFEGEGDPAQSYPQTRTSINGLTKAEVQSLLRLCHKHCVSPQEACTVAAVYALFLTARAKGHELKGSAIRICHWMDLRRFQNATNENRDPLGMWLCPIFTKHKFPKHSPKQASFWSKVQKFAETLQPDQEPWKRTFREYHNIFSDVNKQCACEEPEFDVKTPRAHVSMSFLDARNQKMTFKLAASKQESMERASTAMLPPDDPRFSIASGDITTSTLAPNVSLSIDEYHVTSSVSPRSVSSLSLTVVLNDSSASCTLGSDTSKVPRVFAEAFLDTFCQVLRNMTATSSKNRHSSVIDKLPPYVRARLMTNPPDMSNA